MPDCMTRKANLEAQKNLGTADDCGECDWGDVPEAQRGAWRTCPRHLKWKEEQAERILGPSDN